MSLESIVRAATQGAVQLPDGVYITAIVTLTLGILGFVGGRLIKKPAYTDLWERMEKLEKKESDAVEKATLAAADAAEVKGVFRTWLTNLILWDRGGRPGDLPLPSELELEKLGVDL